MRAAYPGQMLAVRPAAVAGSFYPGDPGELAALVRGLLDEASARLPADLGPVEALLLPHAGYVYSGSVAALGYAALARAATPVTRAVVLAPAHRVAVEGLALPEVDSLATPLGEVPVEPVPLELRRRLPQIVDSVAAHALEHAVEVQLPFLQTVCPEAAVVPLVVGRAAPERVAEVIDALRGGPETVVVVSSDLSHYHPHAEAVGLDRVTVAQVLALDGPLRHDQACGATPLNGLLVSARRRGLRSRLLGQCTSGDTAGDPRRVVGYAAVAFAPPRD